MHKESVLWGTVERCNHLLVCLASHTFHLAYQIVCLCHSGQMGSSRAGHFLYHVSHPGRQITRGRYCCCSTVLNATDPGRMWGPTQPYRRTAILLRWPSRQRCSWGPSCRSPRPVRPRTNLSRQQMRSMPILVVTTRPFPIAMPLVQGERDVGNSAAASPPAVAIVAAITRPRRLSDPRPSLTREGKNWLDESRLVYGAAELSLEALPGW